MTLSTEGAPAGEYDADADNGGSYAAALAALRMALGRERETRPGLTAEEFLRERAARWHL